MVAPPPVPSPARAFALGRARRRRADWATVPFAAARNQEARRGESSVRVRFFTRALVIEMAGGGNGRAEPQVRKTLLCRPPFS
jgi:hypothetical protein